jgi:hypothetical protein
MHPSRITDQIRCCDFGLQCLSSVWIDCWSYAGDEEKAGLLRRLVPGAGERLRLFEADLFDAATFAPAIAGCRFVFLVATPYGLESASSKVDIRLTSIGCKINLLLSWSWFVV